MIKSVQNLYANTPANETFSGLAASKNAKPNSGTYHGLSITLMPSISSLIADAQEELSVLAGERAEEEDRFEHKFEENSSTSERAETLEKLQKTLRDLGLSDRKIESLYGYLNKSRHQTLAELMSGLEEQFSSPSEEYAALLMVKQKLRKEGKAASDELIQKVDAMLANLMQDHSTRIRADMNIAACSYDHSRGDIEEARNLRELYSEAVIGYEAMPTVYQHIRDKYGVEGIESGIGFLINAIGDDISSKGSSMRGQELKAVRDDLYQLQSLITFQDSAKRLIANMQAICEGSLKSVTPPSVMDGFFSLLSSDFIGPSEVFSLAKDLGVSETTENINFFRELRHLAEKMPDKVYSSSDQRLNVIDVISEAQDEAIEEEENAMD